MPPSTDVANKQSLMSLEHLSAVAIAKDTRNHQILAQTPAHLHKVIWRAYLTDKYYINFTHNVTSLMKLKEVDPRLESVFRFDELPELLYAWQRWLFIGREIKNYFPNYC